jgi:hypothetical protein
MMLLLLPMLPVHTALLSNRDDSSRHSSNFSLQTGKSYKIKRASRFIPVTARPRGPKGDCRISRTEALPLVGSGIDAA